MLNAADLLSQSTSSFVFRLAIHDFISWASQASRRAMENSSLAFKPSALITGPDPATSAPMQAANAALTRKDGIDEATISNPSS